MSTAKETLLVGGICLGLLAAALVLIRQFAPSLLGLGLDMQLVQSDERVAPFYQNAIRSSDISSPNFLIPDPILKTRARPFLPAHGGTGPHDLLGLRNHAVPNSADIIAIGDSQTYGNNVVVALNWPNTLQRILRTSGHAKSVYSMATGGWGAIQYLEVSRYAAVFSPKTLIVAFYTGNDPIDTFTLAYASEHWKRYRLNPKISASDAPRVKFPPPDEEIWSPTFKNGISTGFIPAMRRKNSESSPAMDTAYEIMAQVAKDISSIANETGAEVLFTIIPTKEWLYGEKVSSEFPKEMPKEYAQLLEEESARIDWFSQQLASAGNNAQYVDVTLSLKAAIASGQAIYPENINGHPIQAGYEIIAKTIAEELKLPENRATEGYAVIQRPDFSTRALVIGKKYWFAPTDQDTDHLPKISREDSNHLQHQGYLNDLIEEMNASARLINGAQRIEVIE